MNAFSMDRRGFIRAVGLAGLAAGASALPGCASTSDKNESSGDARGAKGLTLPTYQRYEGVTPGLPGNADGLPDAFFNYPRPAVQGIDDPPGSGDPITIVTQSANVPPAQDKNSYWQGLNDRLGVKLDIDFTPVESYTARLQTLLAGGQLPELVSIVPGLPRLPDVVNAEFANLTDFLSGDAILEYPFLANYAPLTWRSSVYNGRIAVIPTVPFVGTGYTVTRLDHITPTGLPAQPTSAEEFFELSVAVTNKNENIYAFSRPPSIVHALIVSPMFGAPYSWDVDDEGSFVRDVETDEYVEALEFVKRMWEAGVFHPDAFTGLPEPELFKGGKIAFGIVGSLDYQQFVGVSGLELGFMAPPKSDGTGMARKTLTASPFRMAGIRKDVPDNRIKEILGVMNWLAAPFGTEEYLYRFWGAEGKHHTWDEELQVPVGNATLDTEALTLLEFLVMTNRALFDPGHDNITKAFYEIQADMIENGQFSAADGLFSETNDRNGANIEKPLADARDAIIQGRRPLSDWSKAVDDWRKAGGDTIRSEYERAYADAEILR